MARVPKRNSPHWVPLRVACQMLEVNEATLRKWADQGVVRAYRTPGGHRRFSREALVALVERGATARNGALKPDLADVALHRIRRRLHARSQAPLSWFQKIDEAARHRMRLFGRHLLDLAADATHPGSHRSVLPEARLVGEAYGEEMAHLGVSLEEAIQAFIFFRNSLLDGAGQTGGPAASAEATLHLWKGSNAVADEVLKALVRAYQTADRGPRDQHLDDGGRRYSSP